MSKQRGFSTLETILVIVIIALVGGAGYYVWHSKHTKNTTTTATVVVAKSSTPKTAVNPYAGWQEYCAPIEKACFKYPSDWVVQADEASDPAADRITVTAPNGTKLAYNSGVTGIGGGCDPSSDIHVFVTKADVQKNVSGLYVVSTGKGTMTTTNIGLSSNQDKGLPTTGDTGQCLYYTIFAAHHDATLGAWLQASKITASTDIPVIEKIMQSYYYQQ